MSLMKCIILLLASFVATEIMRLIRIDSLSFETFEGDRLPPYAAVSHTWGSEEVDYFDIVMGTAPLRRGFPKLRKVCQWAEHDGLHHVWVDSCCINQDDTFERNEALKSAERLFRSAEVCYVFLDGTSLRFWAEHENTSPWWTRRWTLKDLIAQTSSKPIPPDSENDLSSLSSFSPLHVAHNVNEEKSLIISAPETQLVTSGKNSPGVAISTTETKKQVMLTVCAGLTKFLRQHSANFHAAAFWISCVTNSTRPLHRSELLDARRLSGTIEQSDHVLNLMLEDRESVFTEDDSKRIFFRLRGTNMFVQNMGVAGIDASHQTLARVCRASITECHNDSKTSTGALSYPKPFASYAQQNVDFHYQAYRTQMCSGVQKRHAIQDVLHSGLSSPVCDESENGALSACSSSNLEWTMVDTNHVRDKSPED